MEPYHFSHYYWNKAAIIRLVKSMPPSQLLLLKCWTVPVDLPQHLVDRAGNSGLFFEIKEVFVNDLMIILFSVIQNRGGTR